MSASMVGVFYSNREPSRGSRAKAAFWVPYQTALEMVQSLFATWDRKAKYLILKTTHAEMHKTAQSLSMGPNVTFQAAAGSEYYMELVKAWGWLQ